MKPNQLLAGRKAIRKWVDGLSDLDKLILAAQMNSQLKAKKAAHEPQVLFANNIG